MSLMYYWCIILPYTIFGAKKNQDINVCSKDSLLNFTHVKSPDYPEYYWILIPTDNWTTSEKYL